MSELDEIRKELDSIKKALIKLNLSCKLCGQKVTAKEIEEFSHRCMVEIRRARSEGPQA